MGWTHLAISRSSQGVRCSSVVRAFAHGAMGRRIDPTWDHLAISRSSQGVRCSSVVRAFAHGAMGRWIDPSWWTHLAISRFS